MKMNSEEKVKLYAAFYKWVDGESMSTQDITRLINLFKNGSIQIDASSPDKIAALQNEMVNTLEMWANNIKKTS